MMIYDDLWTWAACYFCSIFWSPELNVLNGERRCSVPRRQDLSYELEALHLDEMSLGPGRKSPGIPREVVSSTENDESRVRIVRDLVETVHCRSNMIKPYFLPIYTIYTVYIYI